MRARRDRAGRFGLERIRVNRPSPPWGSAVLAQCDAELEVIAERLRPRR